MSDPFPPGLCAAPGCRNPVGDGGICDSCDAWVSEEVAKLGGDDVAYIAPTVPAEVLREPAPIERSPDGVGYKPRDPFVGTVRAERERFGQSALPRFNPYSIPKPIDPKAVDCPYCVKRPRNLREHCRAVHPNKPEAR
jgi:hypothetical protein